MWYICPKCNGEGLILRGKIWVTDNFIEPVSPPTSPR